MNQKNLDYLKEGLKYLGFGEGLNEKLTENVSQQKDQFQLKTVNEYGPDKANYVLDFKKSEQSDMYFFNKYTATIKSGEPDEKSQTFFPKKNSGITAKEAFNLLNGRSVNKDLTNAEGQPYNAWLQIDWSQKDNYGNHKFKMIHQGYGYNLEKELQKHPIKELSEPATKERMMQSLERGNLHQVTFVKGDKEEKMFIEANPQFKTLNLYDSSLKKVFQENPKKEIKTEEQEGPQKKEAIKNPPSAEEPEADSVRNKKTGRKKLSV